MVLIEITNGTQQTKNGIVSCQKLYEIQQDAGDAIVGITPPPVLQNLDWQSLRPSHRKLLEIFFDHWITISYWSVYFATKAVDIREYPFTTDGFLDRRAEAELYRSQLELCAVIWEAIDVRDEYPTPYHWWKNCMIESQQSQLDQLLVSGGTENTLPLKGQAEDESRKFLRELKKNNNPLEKTPKTQHLHTLYEEAIAMQKDSIEVKKAWNDYLKKFNLRIRALKNNREIKSLVHFEMGLYYQEKRNLVPILTRICSK